MPARRMRFFERQTISIVLLLFSISAITGGLIGAQFAIDTTEKNRVALLEKINQDRDWQIANEQKKSKLDAYLTKTYDSLSAASQKSVFQTTDGSISTIKKTEIEYLKFLDGMCYNKSRTIRETDITAVTKSRFISNDIRQNFISLQQNDKDRGDLCTTTNQLKALVQVKDTAAIGSIYLQQLSQTNGQHASALLGLKTLVQSGNHTAELRLLEAKYGKPYSDYFKTVLTFFNTYYSYLNSTDTQHKQQLGQSILETSDLLEQQQAQAMVAANASEQTDLESQLKQNIERYKLIVELNKYSTNGEFIFEQWSFPILKSALQLLGEKNGHNYPHTDSIKEVTKILADKGYIDNNPSLFGAIQYSVNSDDIGFTLTIPGLAGKKYRISTSNVPENETSSSTQLTTGSA